MIGMDRGVHILHAGIRQYDRGGVWGAAARLASSSTCAVIVERQRRELH
jgi:hypothetical protein